MKRSFKISVIIVLVFFILSSNSMFFLNRVLDETAEAANVGSSPVVGIGNPGTGSNLTDIAWHPSGDFAVAVSLDGGVFNYDALASNDPWSYVGFAEGPFRAIEYYSYYGNFVIAGGDETLAEPSVWGTDGFSNPKDLFGDLSPQDVEFNSLAVMDNGNILAVGMKGAVYRYEFDGEWIQVTAGGVDEDYFGVTYNLASDLFYFVGYHHVKDQGLFLSYQFGSVYNPVLINGPEYNLNFDGIPLYDVESHISNDEVIVVGDGFFGIYEFYNAWIDNKPPSGLEGNEVFRGVTWVENSEAYVVGDDGTNGIYYHYRSDHHSISRLSDPQEPANTQNGISSTGGGTPKIMSVGDDGIHSSFMISRTSAFKDVLTENSLQEDALTNSGIPEIEHVEIYDSTGNPRLNTQIDVNSHGDTSRIYYIYVKVTHDTPDKLNYVNVKAWFDEQLEGVFSEYPPEDNLHKTRAFNFSAHYDSLTATTTLTQIYPYTEEDDYGKQTEVSLIPNECNWNYEHISGIYIWEIWFAFAPGPQMRYANGEGGNFFEPVISQYKDEALNTRNTWDLHIEASDLDNNKVNMYAEFGVYKFLSLTINGVPDTYYGTGAPGETIELSTPSLEIVKYSANCPHRVKVYAQSDLRSDTSEDVIPASNLYLQGGYANQTLEGYGEPNAVYLIGVGGDTPNWNLPRNRFNYTTTAINTTDESQTDYPILRWWVYIPTGTSRGIYRTNIIYVIEHEG